MKEKKATFERDINKAIAASPFRRLAGKEFQQWLPANRRENPVNADEKLYPY